MFEENEFSKLIKTVLQAEYLLITLVMLYLVFPGAEIFNRQAVMFATVLYTLFLIVYHYVFSKHVTTMTLSGKAFISALFISITVWYTGKSDSPLIMTYLIIVISSAMILPRITTMLLVGFIGASLLLFDFYGLQFSLFSEDNAMVILKQMVNIFMLCLTGYLTNMLAMHMQEAKDKIRNASEIDELTGLLNRRAFTNILYKTYKRYAQYSNQLSVLMVDVDNLKTINDAYGRVIGDRIITLISSVTKRSINSTDLLARHGSDEFVVLLAEAGAEGANRIAEKIRQNVETTPLIIEGGKEIFVTVSIGIATYPETTSLDELLNRADLAMYEGKENGKNQVSLYMDMFAESSDDLAVAVDTDDASDDEGDNVPPPPPAG